MFGVDVLCPTVADADRLAALVVAALGPDGVSVATHLCACQAPQHVSLSIEVSPRADLRLLRETVGPERGAGAAAAASAHLCRTGGRLVHLPGLDRLRGTVTVADALRIVDRVVLLGGQVPDPQTPLVTRDFVRPVLADGALVLTVDPAAGGAVVPFETPTPTPCCVDPRLSRGLRLPRPCTWTPSKSWPRRSTPTKPSSR